MVDQETYSEIILELYKHPMNEGEIKQADVIAQGGNPICGDSVRFSVRMKNGRIENAMFTGQGCAISQASASLLTDTIKGKTIQEAIGMKPEQVFDFLGNIVQTRIKCALLALHVLKEGLKKYQSGERAVVLEGIKI